MDRIMIEKLEVYAYHGVFPEENVVGQKFYLNVILLLDVKKSAKNDALEYSTHYGEVCYFIKEYMEANTFKLIETVAERMAQAILLKFPNLLGIELEVEKPQAPIGLPFKTVKVCVKRRWHTVYIAFGSNMGDKLEHIQEGIKMLEENEVIRVLQCSEFMVTPPYGGIVQEDFVNGVMEISTLLEPEELLEQLHEIENSRERKRIQRWGPRTLDLDIVFYDQLVFETKKLIIPHIDMENRTFVLEPMVQLNANFRHPILNKTMGQLLASLESKNA